MVAMVKVFLLLLFVFKATSLENSRETVSDHELNSYTSPALAPCPLSHPPPSSPSPFPILITTPRLECLKNCNTTCEQTQKTPFLTRICIGVCGTRCPPHFPDEISCPLDCALSSTSSLRYDASMVEDRVSSCYKQCRMVSASAAKNAREIGI